MLCSPYCAVLPVLLCLESPGDPLFSAVHGELDRLLDPRLFVGRASEQVAEFMSECVDPLLAQHGGALARKSADELNC